MGNEEKKNIPPKPEQKPGEPQMQNPAAPTQEQAKVLEGTYANFVRVIFSRFEFLFDFGQVVPEGKETVHLKSRVIMSPHHARAFKELLDKKIAEFEESHGPLDKDGDMQNFFKK